MIRFLSGTCDQPSVGPIVAKDFEYEEDAEDAGIASSDVKETE